jgi:predicted O-linked N-acetylglucosamine transferase (SPINDLY family)
MQALRTLLSQGRDAEALSAAREVTQRFPQQASGWKTLADLLQRAGDGLQALAAFRKAAALSPADFDVHYQLGVISQAVGQLSEAEAHYRRALQLRPKHAAALRALGRVLLLEGRPADAERWLRSALQMRSTPDTHSSLGDVLFLLGHRAEAEVNYRRALQLQPDLFEVHNNLGNLYHVRGQLAEAKTCFQRASELQPQAFEPHNNLGNVFLAMGLLADAEGSFQRALHLKPDLAEVHHNLGNVQWTQGRFSEAGARFQRAVQLTSSYALAHNSLGIYHQALGQHAEAEESYRRALRHKPDYAEAYSNLLLSLVYRPDLANETVATAHREYQARFGSRLEQKWPGLANRRRELDSGRPLRVGYVSPDLHQHPVASFVLPLLRAHDAKAVDVFCYANVVRPDAVTAALRELAAHWLSTVGMSHESLAERIVADEIDVLVDLAGHTAGNRLPVFARKPAPVQISWLGYPNTTGLSTMDYRLVDAITDPPGEADRLATETLIRLDGGFLCFEPAADAPNPGAPPCIAADAVTFGSFNNLAKLSAPTLDVWTEILARVPDSRLLLKASGLEDETIRRDFLARFGRRGVDLERIDLLGRAERLSDHLALYGQVDVALDPFPYNGTTTTCEALWMGVPVVTVLGDRHAGRVGASLLMQVGLSEWVATSAEHYIELARTLASDRDHLSLLRRTMRARMSISSLCDARSFARKMEATYRARLRQAIDHSNDLLP